MLRNSSAEAIQEPVGDQVTVGEGSAPSEPARAAGERRKRSGAGRPRGSKNKRTIMGSEALRPLVAKAKRALIEALDSKDGDVRLKAAVTVLSYTFGKPRESVQLSGPENGPIELNDAGTVQAVREILFSLEVAKRRTEAKRAAIGHKADEAAAAVDVTPQGAIGRNRGSVPESGDVPRASEPEESLPLGVSVKQLGQGGRWAIYRGDQLISFASTKPAAIQLARSMPAPNSNSSSEGEVAHGQ